MNKDELLAKLGQIDPRIWKRDALGSFEPQPAPIVPKLVIAATYREFEQWCMEHQLVWLGKQRQAIYVTEPYHLSGIANLAERLVIVSYPRGERGYWMQRDVEARLAHQKESS